MVRGHGQGHGQGRVLLAQPGGGGRGWGPGGSVVPALGITPGLGAAARPAALWGGAPGCLSCPASLEPWASFSEVTLCLSSPGVKNQEQAFILLRLSSEGENTGLLHS